LGLFGSFLPAYAEPYPTRPIKVIVPTPAGGPVDVVARLVSNYLAAAFGQAVVVDNRPGAGNTIGSKEAAQAEPDGYTLLYSSASGLVLAPMLQKNAGYDPLTSYDPIALVAQSSNILVVHPSVPVGSVQELVAYAKANPGKVNFSSGGIGVLPHLIGEWFKSAAAIDIVHVPYRGGGPSINDLVAGQVQMTFEGTSVLLPLIQSGSDIEQSMGYISVSNAWPIRSAKRKAAGAMAGVGLGVGAGRQGKAL
jgi:tripartite-type tricarboxylate transporter receptor subunit TctC